MRALVLAVLGLLAGCGPSPTATPGATPEASAAASGAASASPGPSATEVVMELRASTTEVLAPGRYERPGFERPRFTFAVEPGTEWYAVQLFDGFFDIQQDVGSPDVTAVQFARPEAAYGADGDATELTAAADLPAILQANPGLEVVAVDTSRIGGLEGSHVTVANRGETGAAVLRVPPGPLSILPGRALWISGFDTPDGILAILVGGPIDGFDKSLLLAEPVLESIVVDVGE